MICSHSLFKGDKSRWFEKLKYYQSLVRDKLSVLLTCLVDDVVVDLTNTEFLFLPLFGHLSHVHFSRRSILAHRQERRQPLPLGLQSLELGLFKHLAVNLIHIVQLQLAHLQVLSLLLKLHILLDQFHL